MIEAESIVVRGRGADLTSEFRDFATEKLTRVGRFGEELHRIDAEVTEDGRADGSVTVELTCVGRGPVIRAEAYGADVYAAFDLALGRLEQRLRRASDRRTRVDRRAGSAKWEEIAAEAVVPLPVGDLETQLEEDRADGTTDDASDDPSVLWADGPMVVREKHHPANPMTVADALLAMELVGHDFYLFHDSDTATASVVYRRHAYDYGVLRLVEPA